MPKVLISQDEWYPVYDISDFHSDYNKVGDLSDSDLDFVKRAYADFDLAQDILREAHKKGEWDRHEDKED